jgi:hypothetical protein
MITPERQAFKPGSGRTAELSIPGSGDVLGKVAQKVFSIDGMDSRALSRTTPYVSLPPGSNMTILS